MGCRVAPTTSGIPGPASACQSRSIAADSTVKVRELVRVDPNRDRKAACIGKRHEREPQVAGQGRDREQGEDAGTENVDRDGRPGQVGLSEIDEPLVLHRAPNGPEAPEPRPEERLGGHHRTPPGPDPFGGDQRQPDGGVGLADRQRHVERADVVAGLASVPVAEQRHGDAGARPQPPDRLAARVEQGTDAARDQVQDDVVDATAVRARHAFGERADRAAGSRAGAWVRPAR